jgi:hypothetical protein
LLHDGYPFSFGNPPLADHGRLIPDFFEPIQFYRQFADLAVEQIRFAVCGHRLGPALAFKQRTG